MIKILDYTNKPLSLMGEVASVCWDSKPSKHIGIACLESGHDRVSEFADITVEISGYSARTIRELYTHIQGTSRVQRSTRYVNEGDFDYYIPKSIKNNKQALSEYQVIMNDISNAYKTLEFMDIPKQDIANILPLGSYTTIVLKINIRALIHMCHLRLCTRALDEFRSGLMVELLDKTKNINEEYKFIVDNYCKVKCEVVGYCSEQHCCGKMPRKEDVI